MRRIIGTLLLVVLVVACFSCAAPGHPHRHHPRGHAKKVYRGKPAKRHGPGHHKKKGGKKHRSNGNRDVLFPRKR
ncbi:hypothetical protein [Sphingobacterium deserti]|uniref:Secreted protein n=1 Tax=Sphingobacterium deserti TaxID=1229276 RepID=A0A0B8T0E8_9SPHI|nr:hypothetical protein [Sphingobacterium deserti]KGE13746.1 hypothetical protein DI53_2486 [Sphingobacterium deserti]